MKIRLVWVAVLAALLAGCAGDPVYETIGDVWEQTEPAASPGRMEVPLPEGAEMEVMEGYGDSYYRVGTWDLWTNVLSGGDVQKSIQTLSAMDINSLTVLKRTKGELQCFETTWTVTSEEGQRVVRAGILDDGNYHYCLCVSAPEEEAEEAGAVFAEILNGVRITDTEP